MNWKRILCIFGHRYPITVGYDPMPNNQAAYAMVRANRCSRCGYGDDRMTIIESRIVNLTPVSELFARRVAAIYQNGDANGKDV